MKNAKNAGLTNVGEMFDYPEDSFFNNYFKENNIQVNVVQKNISDFEQSLETLQQNQAIIISYPSNHSLPLSKSSNSSHLISFVKEVKEKKLILNSSNNHSQKMSKNTSDYIESNEKLKEVTFSYTKYFKKRHTVMRMGKFKWRSIISRHGGEHEMYSYIRELEKKAAHKGLKETNIEFGTYLLLEREQ